MTAVGLAAWLLGTIVTALVFALGYGMRVSLRALVALALLAGGFVAYMVTLVGMAVTGVTS